MAPSSGKGCKTHLKAVKFRSVQVKWLNCTLSECTHATKVTVLCPSVYIYMNQLKS